jgi:hypothetical protein
VPADPSEAPIVFTGRGGSGTRLLSQLADDTGVFIGNQRNRSGDSIEWVDTVYRIVAEIGGRRELPTGSAYRRPLRAQAARILERSTSAWTRWGLKLPEMMLILPLIVDAFAQAKIVHLVRHPVSSSLRRTHMTSRLDNPVGAATLPAAYRYCGRDVALIATDAPYVHNACSWNFQVGRVLRYGREVLGADRYRELAYENVCIDPAGAAGALRSFLGGADERRGASIAVDVARANAWDPHDPRVDLVWSLCGETASLLDYTREPPASA